MNKANIIAIANITFANKIFVSTLASAKVNIAIPGNRPIIQTNRSFHIDNRVKPAMKHTASSGKAGKRKIMKKFPIPPSEIKQSNFDKILEEMNFLTIDSPSILPIDMAMKDPIDKPAIVRSNPCQNPKRNPPNKTASWPGIGANSTCNNCMNKKMYCFELP